MATIPTYKKTQKIALACCRMAKCEKLVEGKCTAYTKEECAIENTLEELHNYTHVFKDVFNKTCKRNAYDYVSKYHYNSVTFKPYSNPVIVRIACGTLRACREALRIKAEKEAFWKEHEKERVWEKSYRELKGIGKWGYWIHEDTCWRCPNQFDGKCLKYSDERICAAEEYCNKWGTELSIRGFETARSKEERARYEHLRSLDDGSIEGYYASSALRGGWTGD